MRMMTSFISGVFTAGLAALRGGSTSSSNDTHTQPSLTTADILAQGGVMRKSWRMDKAGRISDLHQVEEPLVRPGNGEVRVAVKAVGLNMADVFAIIGLYGATPQGSFVPGLEYSGVIEAVGPHCSTGVKTGDRVLGFTRFGAYTSHLNVPELYVRTIPSGWTYAQGASFVVQGLTAWHAMVELGNVKRNQTVLVHSAAGGVGCLALELCEKLKAFPVATIGTDSKLGFLQKRFGLKREQIIVRETNAKGFAAQLHEALVQNKRSEEGYDLILDALGGMYFKEGYKKLSRGGRMITFGAADYLSTTDKPNWFKIIPRYLTRPTLDPGDMCGENRGVLGFNLIWLTDKVKELNAELDAMLSYDWRPPHVGSTFPFSQLPDAVRSLQTGLTIGKVVVLLDDEEHDKA